MSDQSAKRATPEDTLESLRMEKASLLYFAVVFLVGLGLGTMRVLVVEPRLGARVAELLEMPLMFIVIAMTASWIVRRVTLHATIEWLTVGAIAVCLLLFSEAVLVVQLRGMDISEYIRQRDPVAGACYLVLLLVFAAAPGFFWYRSHPRVAGPSESGAGDGVK